MIIDYEKGVYHIYIDNYSRINPLNEFHIVSDDIKYIKKAFKENINNRLDKFILMIKFNKAMKKCIDNQLEEDIKSLRQSVNKLILQMDNFKDEIIDNTNEIKNIINELKETI
jgi:hypothetical protein